MVPLEQNKEEAIEVLLEDLVDTEEYDLVVLNDECKNV